MPDMMVHKCAIQVNYRLRAAVRVPLYWVAGVAWGGAGPERVFPMATLKFQNPPGIAKPGGYTHVVEAMGPGRIVYIAGQLGLKPDGQIAGDFRAQCTQAFENLTPALKSVGATWNDVVKLNNYLVDIGTNLSAYRDVRDKYVNTSQPPASTTIGVPALARPDALFESEAVVLLAK
jgi:2-iminobutanoate/2-iminopropanoate deaminase